MPPPTEQSFGHSTSKPITSFFAPIKKPESSNDRPKIAVKSSLKSNNLPTFATKTATFSPTKPISGPFSLSRNNSNSSSTDSISKNLAKFRFEEGGSKKPPTDLNSTSRNLKQKQTFDDENDDEDGSDSDEVSFKRVLRTRKPTKKIISYMLSSDEDEAEGEGSSSDTANKKRKRNIFDSDEENQDADDMMDDTVDEAYVDANEKINNAYAAKVEQGEIERVKRVMPEKSYEEIQQAIQQAGSVVGASRILMREGSSMKNKRTRIADDEALMERKQKELSELQRDRLVLKYFNTCTSKDLQDVTGCKPEAANKIVEELRPFIDIEDLETKLKRNKGTSAKYIDTLQEMMDGYTAVDQVIESVENLGSELRDVLKIWEELETENTRHASSPSSQDALEDEQDESAGLHLSKLDMSLVRDKSSPEYQDAMKGYLVQQPEIINKDMTLKDYQILGINWMLLLYRKGISGILADEMGLGKTAQVISFLGRLYELGEQGPHLIVVPSSTIENWAREFERFCPTLEVRIYHGSMKEREELRYDLKAENKLKAFQVIITTYQLATGQMDDRKFLKKLFCHSMILDEGHMVKNCSSSRYKALMGISTPFRLLLTGTPLQNNLQELVSLLTFIMPSTFADNQEAVRSVFKIRNAVTSSSDNKNEASVQVLSKARIERAKKMMTPFLLRRKKEDVLKDLPQKIQVIERCEMTKSQAEVYSDIITNTKKSYEKSLLEPDQPQQPKSAMTEQFESMTNIVIHLRKAADHPLLFRKIYNNDLLKKMTKDIRRDVKYWDTNEEYVYEDMTVMSDFELHKLCQENRVSICKYIYIYIYI
jgi:SWI/SNF-related matrix-associated actin-dependent regulator 1 of chromatin subfamily A